MAASIKNIIRQISPPVLVNTFQKIKNRRYGWKGDYSSWENADKASSGYNSNEILNKVRNSLLKVKRGEAVYERDSVLFEEIQYSWQLLSCLMFAAAISDGKLSVLDFGGSLGSTYFQNKKFLDRMDDVSWNIVEQKHFVDAGKADFEDERLHFYYNVEECKKEQNPNILVLSSVLQYIENPYSLLDKLLKYDFEFILIDRTPFNIINKDRITIQIVPPDIYEASYPCHIFNPENFNQYFEKNHYKLIEIFDALDGGADDYIFKGMIYNKSEHV